MKRETNFDDDVLDTPAKHEKSTMSGSKGLIMIVGALAIVLSVAISFMLQQSISDNTKYAKPEEVGALQEKVNQLEIRLAEREKHIELLLKAYPAMNSKIENSTGASMQRIMIQQESNIQLFLKNLKSGMYDLAHMIPGSRTWLEHYNESMNSAIQKSIERSRSLKRINSGVILIEPDAR